MTLEQLDAVRGWSIAAVILSFVIVGVTSKLSSSVSRRVGIAAQLIGGCAGLTFFTILNFVTGWDAYFAAKAPDHSAAAYQGRHVIAAHIIERLGETDASGLGIVFGLLGFALIASAVLNIRRLKTFTHGVNVHRSAKPVANSPQRRMTPD